MEREETASSNSHSKMCMLKYLRLKEMNLRLRTKSYPSALRQFTDANIVRSTPALENQTVIAVSTGNTRASIGNETKNIPVIRTVLPFI